MMPFFRFKKSNQSWLIFSSLHVKRHDGKLNILEDMKAFLWAFDAAISIPNTMPAEPIISRVNLIVDSNNFHSLFEQFLRYISMTKRG